jgi:hydrogenase expression/formation protein HypC
MCLGIPGQIVSIEDADNLVAIVDVGGVKRAVNLSCIVEEQTPLESYVGDWVLLHVGFAMSRIDEVEAQATLAVLNELGEMQQELLAMQAGTQ